MTVHYISTECYPAAKVGGLADVTGALPKYINADVKVILPKYATPWFTEREYETVYSAELSLPGQQVPYQIQKVNGHNLGFPFYVIDVPGLLDRDGVYASADGYYFEDEAERYTAFQRAYCEWLLQTDHLPDVIHCQDHHTGLIPFMTQHVYSYERLKGTATVFTIHNERYQGSFDWEKQYLLPAFDTWKSGLMDWDHKINPLASGIKCADAVTTVSPSYMSELKQDSYGLEWLFNHESDKLQGILNGIDHEVWNPRTDTHLPLQLKRSVAKYKGENKKLLLQDTALSSKKPLVTYIGRFAVEKGADLLPGIMEVAISDGLELDFFILGTGDKAIEASIANMAKQYPDRIRAVLAYNETLAHQLYAASDFLIMPSRVEPCGLNQMYALRYGTIPIVHNIGGLRDSIIDINTDGGYGIKHSNLHMSTIQKALVRALDLYSDADTWKQTIQKAMSIDFSWDRSAAEYLNLYMDVIEKARNNR